MVRSMSASDALPKMPQATTRSAGTAPAQASVFPASAQCTSIVARPSSSMRSDAAAALAGSSSTSRPTRSAPRPWVEGHAEHVVALPRAQAHEVDGTGWRSVERGADQLDDDLEALVG